MDPVTIHERHVHIIDDEAKVRDALTLLLSTAKPRDNCETLGAFYYALGCLPRGLP
jgi:hypothetical protein